MEDDQKQRGDRQTRDRFVCVCVCVCVYVFGTDDQIRHRAVASAVPEPSYGSRGCTPSDKSCAQGICSGQSLDGGIFHAGADVVVSGEGEGESGKLGAQVGH